MEENIPLSMVRLLSCVLGSSSSGSDDSFARGKSLSSSQLEFNVDLLFWSLRKSDIVIRDRWSSVGLCGIS